MNDQKEFLQLLIEAVPTIKSEEEIRKGFTYLSENKEDMNLLTEAISKYKITRDEESKNIIKSIWDKATGVTTAKFGAKLNYIQALKNRCPEGTQLYKVGGRVECKKCGGSAKVKPAGKKRFLSNGDNIEFEQADVNQPIPRIEHVIPLKKTLSTEVPFNSEGVKTKVNTIHFAPNPLVKDVSRIIVSTPQNTDTFYTITPKIPRFNYSERAEQIYNAHQTNKKK